MRDWSLLTRIVPCVIILLLAAHASAIPPMPTEFYGSVAIDGKPAPAGTNISALIDGVQKGSIKTVVDGFYGGPGIFDDRLKVSVPEDQYKPGMMKITFIISGMPATQTVDFEPGVSKQLDLVAGAGAPAMTSLSTAVTTMKPVDNGTLVPSEYNASVQNSYPNAESYSSYGSPSGGSTISYGLDQDRSFSAEDGLAEIRFGKSTMLFSPDGQFLNSVGIRSKGISDLPPLSTNTSLKFTGYAYEIIPSETYFNPKGSLVLKLPPERAYDIIGAGPILYEYISQTATWEPVHTFSSVFTNEITGDIYEAAIYGLYVPVSGSTNNLTIQPSQSSGVSLNQTQDMGGNLSVPPVLIPPDPVITPQVVLTPDTQVGVQVTSPVTPVITPLPVVTTESQKPAGSGSPAYKIPGVGAITTSIGFLKSKMTRTTLAVIGVVALFIVINAAVYAVYRYWWQKRKQNG